MPLIASDCQYVPISNRLGRPPWSSGHKMGYCPGTGVAALGDGLRHAIPGLFGMLAGAAVYAQTHPTGFVPRRPQFFGESALGCAARVPQLSTPPGRTSTCAGRSPGS
jgi:hypothetical protein